MATNVHMEALSPTMEEGQLVRWLKKEGDAVSEGDVLAEIETDKATMELVARGSGVLRSVRLAEGETAAVGTVIAVIAGAGESVVDAADSGGPAAGGGAVQGAAAVEEPKPAPGSRGGRGVDASGRESPAFASSREAGGERGPAPRAGPASDGENGGRVKASPLARRLAAEAGLELSAIAGSGPGGRITRADIEAAVESGAGRPGAEPTEEAARPGVAAAVADGADVEEVPVSQMRKTIAKRLATSIGPVPTFYLTVDVDAARLQEARARLNERLAKDGVKASVNDFVLKAVAMALARHPEVNAAWGDGVIYRHRRVHVGVAVAVEDGLITPVVRDADRKGIAAIAAEVRELAGRARERKLKPEEYTGATFSVSNLGMFGIEAFTAIINPPEAGILAVGALEDRVVAERGQPVVRPRMRMTMSCDHRVIDGATGARFLQTLTSYLEDPLMMLA